MSTSKNFSSFLYLKLYSTFCIVSFFLACLIIFFSLFISNNLFLDINSNKFFSLENSSNFENVFLNVKLESAIVPSSEITTKASDIVSVTVSSATGVIFKALYFIIAIM